MLHKNYFQQYFHINVIIHPTVIHVDVIARKRTRHSQHYRMMLSQSVPKREVNNILWGHHQLEF